MVKDIVPNSSSKARTRVKMSRSGLAIALSALEGFKISKVSVEQYMTDSEVAATVLWDAYMKGDIDGKMIADLGSGTGVLGIGALMLGAKVYFVESESSAMETCKKNVEKVQSESSAEFVLGDVADFEEKVDTVIMNPPFGTKSEHADRKFLEKAFEISNVVYSFHKTSTKSFVEAIAKDNNFEIKQVIDMDYPLKATMNFHKKRIERIKVSVFRLVKKK